MLLRPNAPVGGVLSEAALFSFSSTRVRGLKVTRGFVWPRRTGPSSMVAAGRMPEPGAGLRLAFSSAPAIPPSTPWIPVLISAPS